VARHGPLPQPRPSARRRFARGARSKPIGSRVCPLKGRGARTAPGARPDGSRTSPPTRGGEPETRLAGLAAAFMPRTWIISNLSPVAAGSGPPSLLGEGARGRGQGGDYYDALAVNVSASFTVSPTPVTDGTSGIEMPKSLYFTEVEAVPVICLSLTTVTVASKVTV